MKNKFLLIFFLFSIFFVNLESVHAYLQPTNQTSTNGTITPMYGTNPLTDYFILDAPSYIENSKNTIPILAIDNDAFLNLESIQILDANNGDTIVASTAWNPSLSLSGKVPFFYTFNLNKNNLVKINNIVSIKAKFKLSFWPDVVKSVDVLISSVDVPKLNNWYCGDTHLHANYTNNLVEFGAPLYATIDAAESMGLDWVTITDHSFDLDDEVGKWDNYKNDCNSISNCLVGEEISCRWDAVSLSHYLGYNINNLILGDADDNILGTTYSCEEVVNMVNNQGGFGYVAHPMASDLQLNIFYRVKWRNYTYPFKGLEIWNGDISTSTVQSEVNDGLEKWKELLLSGRKVFIEAGSDAHGDFNSKLGKTMTCCYSPDFSKSNIYNSLENGQCYMTNNGALKFTLKGTYDNTEKTLGNQLDICSGEQLTLKIDYKFSDWCNLTVYKGYINSSNEIIYPSIILKGPGLYSVDDSSNYKNGYYRVECINKSTSKRIYTNPIWFNVHDCSTTTTSTTTTTTTTSTTTPTTIPPICELTSPQNKTYDTHYIEINFNVDHQVKYIKRALNSDTFYIVCSDCSSYTKTISFSDGAKQLKMRAVDYNSNIICQKTVNFSVDTVLPTISKITPTNKSYVKGNAEFSVRYTEKNLKSVSLFYGTNGIYKEFALSNCEPGSYKMCKASVDLSSYDGQQVAYNFTIGDVVHNKSSKMMVVNVDNTIPTITIKSPFNQTYSSSYVRIDLKLNEVVDSLKMSINGGSFSTLCSDCDSYNRTRSFSSKRAYNVTFQAIDKAENVGYTSVVFTRV